MTMTTVMTKKIMVIDDDADMLKLLEVILGRAGFSISKFNMPSAAMKTLAHAMPDLVVLDIMMPEISGLELCRRIRQDPALSHIPVILLSARGDTHTINEGYKAGATDYITKTNLRTLVTAINNIFTLA